MNIYLAARYGRRKEIAAIAERLEKHHHAITSTWVWGEHEAADQSPTTKEARTWATDDLTGICQADAFVLFAEPDPQHQGGRGGRWVELGYALGLMEGWPNGNGLDYIFLVGQPEPNIFTHLPEIEPVPDADALVNRLNACEIGANA